MRGQRRAAAPAVLDMHHLASLEAHLGASETRELMSDGMIELTDRLGRLSERPQGKALAMLSHDIAGIAGQLGMSRLAHHAGLASRAAETGLDPGGDVAAVLALREESFDALRAWCARRLGWSGPAAGP